VGQKRGRKAGKPVRASRALTAPKEPAKVQRQDHFQNNRASVDVLNKLIQERDPRLQCSSASHLHKQLSSHAPLKHLADLFAISTLNGWFSFTHDKTKPMLPEPTNSFLQNLQAGHLSTMRCGGRKAVLKGAEDSLDKVAKELQQLRKAGVSLNSVSSRALIVSQLVADGHQDMLSPHLLNSNLHERDKSKFLCSAFWMRAFFINRCGMSWRASTKAAQKLPEDWESLIHRALQRIAAAAASHDIPSERVYMADETFMFYTPESKCATHHTWLVGVNLGVQ
jgi:hypothetical protein